MRAASSATSAPGFTDEAIVLRRVDYGETDRVLTVLTQRHGKIGVMARGVRRAGSRHASATDLFVRSRMQLARGRGSLAVLTQAQRTGPPPEVGDARHMACAAVCAELADRVLEPDHPLDDDIFPLVAEALDACAVRARDPRAALAWFSRRMIDRLGYAPELESCAHCATSLPERPTRFSAVTGGLLCSRCQAGDPAAVPCSVRTIKVLRVAAAGDAATYWRLRLDATTLGELEAVVESEIGQHIDRRLRSFAVLRAVHQATA